MQSIEQTVMQAGPGPGGAHNPVQRGSTPRPATLTAPPAAYPSSSLLPGGGASLDLPVLAGGIRQQDVMRRLRLTRRQLEYMRAKGRIGWDRSHGEVFYDPAAVEALEEARRRALAGFRWNVGAWRPLEERG